MPLTIIAAFLVFSQTPVQTPTQTPAPAQTTAPAQTYALRWTPKAGDKLKYSSDATFTINGQPSTFTSKSTELVLKVDPDGTFSVQSSVDEGSAIFQGQQFPMPKTIKVTLFKPSGEIVSITGDQVDASTYRVDNLSMLKRPDTSVAVGDTWTEDLKGDPKTGAIGIHGLYKLDSLDKVGDDDALKVTASTRETEGAEAGTVDATYWISKADGSLLKYIAKWSNVTFAGAPTPLSGTLTMTRTKS
jgi:hypothetical protein